MQKKSGAGDSDGESGSGEKINQAQNQQQAKDCAGEIDLLNPANIRMEAWHHAEDIDRKLDGKSGENERDQQQRVDRRGAVLGQHRIQDRGNDNDAGGGEFSAHGQAGINQFTETMSILPNAATDRDQTHADADVGEQHECGLHGVGDGVEGVLMLRQPADEKNSTRKSNQLDGGLHQRVIADAPGVVERSP